MIGLLIILAWISLALKDHLGSKPKYANKSKFYRQKHEPSANNFAIRFFYEMFFEFCLCVLINIRIIDFTSFSPSVQWLTAIIVCGLIVAYVVWLISLFFYNGPFLVNFYNKGTFLRSFWMARPFNTKYDARKKLGWLYAKRER